MRAGHMWREGWRGNYGFYNLKKTSWCHLKEDGQGLLKTQSLGTHPSFAVGQDRLSN